MSRTRTSLSGLAASMTWAPLISAPSPRTLTTRTPTRGGPGNNPGERVDTGIGPERRPSQPGSDTRGVLAESPDRAPGKDRQPRDDVDDPGPVHAAAEQRRVHQLVKPVLRS